MKRCVYINMKKNEGFTISEVLICLLVLLVVVSLSFPLMKLIKAPNYYEELSTRQLFIFIQDEINQSKESWITDNVLYITDFSDRLITIEQKGELIRRRVDSLGNEYLLREVDMVTMTAVQDGFSIKVRMESDNVYQKNIISLVQ